MGLHNRSAVVSRPTISSLQNSALAQIAQYVASTEQIFNINNVSEWLKQYTDFEPDSDIDDTPTILCMPIVNGQKKVIGVAQLINKVMMNSRSEKSSVALTICVFRDFTGERKCLH